MDEKKPLLAGRDLCSPTRDPFEVSSLNSAELDADSLKILAQHSRYKYYTKLHKKEPLVSRLLVSLYLAPKALLGRKFQVK